MHYYKRNLGDYAKKTGRLTMLQHGSYTLLIDACYDRETFPTLEQALEWTWTSNEAEIEAVKFVLNRFFKLDKDGCYVQDRILEELLNYHKNADTNKRIAIERETKRKQKSTKREQTVDEAPPNQEPITNNHKPVKEKVADAFVLPDWMPLETWDAFLAMRKKIKKPATDKAIELLVAKLERYKANGQDIQAVLEKSITSNWQDVFEIKERQSFANKYDVAHVTTPPPPNQDAALRQILEDRKKASKPNTEVQAKIAELLRGKVL
jgi:uncharacterized protein YdaU (DUF1376 family)